MSQLREQSWPDVSTGPISISADGLVITVPSAIGFHPKQKVQVSATGQPTLNLEVKEILSPTTLSLGEVGTSIRKISVISNLYQNGTLLAPAQSRTHLSSEAVWPAVYAEEPTVALRMHSVDYFGQSYTDDNPMPVKIADGDINIGTVNVDLTHKDNYPNTGDIADSVRVGDGNETFTGTGLTEINKYALDVTSLNSLIRVAYDDVEVTQYNDDGDITQIEFRSATQTVAVASITYNTEGDFQRAQVTYV